MVTQDLKLAGNHFIILDVLNSVNENGKTKSYPTTESVDQLDKIVHQSIETVRTRVGNALMLEEKKEDLLRITLNVDADYKIQLFR